MVTGRVPFERKDIYGQIIAIQEQDHPPLSSFVEHIPARLEEIISKALAKDPDQRYQTANDLLVDLRNLKRTLNVDGENARTALFGSRMDSTIVGQVPSNSRPGSTSSAAQHAPYAVSSAEYIVNPVKTHKRAAMLMVVVLAALAG